MEILKNLRPEAKDLKNTIAKTLDIPRKSVNFKAGGKRLAGAKKKKKKLGSISKLGSINGALDHADS